jgi:hypothetical protein
MISIVTHHTVPLFEQEIVFPSPIWSQIAIDESRLLVVLLDGSAYLLNNPSDYFERKRKERSPMHSVRSRMINGFEIFREISHGNVEYASSRNVSKVVVVKEEEEEEESLKSGAGLFKLPISFPVSFQSHLSSGTVSLFGFGKCGSLG